MKHLAVSIVLCICMACRVFSLPVVSFFPENGSCGTWLKAGPEELYSGEELFSLINGGADVYFEYGFDEVKVQKYENNQGEKIQAEIYQMKTDTAAFGIFTFNCSKTGQPTSVGQLAQIGGYSLVSYQDNYFILIRSNQNTPTVHEGFCLLGEKITHQIPSVSKTNFLQLYPDYLVVGQFKYVCGNLALQSVYNFPEVNIFGNNQVISFFNNDTLTIKILSSPQNQVAASFAQLKGQLLNSVKFELVEQTDAKLVLKDKRLRLITLINLRDSIRISIK